jgi:hypothetical protein
MYKTCSNFPKHAKVWVSSRFPGLRKHFQNKFQEFCGIFFGCSHWVIQAEYEWKFRVYYKIWTIYICTEHVQTFPKCGLKFNVSRFEEAFAKQNSKGFVEFSFVLDISIWRFKQNTCQLHIGCGWLVSFFLGQLNMF